MGVFCSFYVYVRNYFVVLMELNNFGFVNYMVVRVSMFKNEKGLKCKIYLLFFNIFGFSRVIGC